MVTMGLVMYSRYSRYSCYSLTSTYSTYNIYIYIYIYNHRPGSNGKTAQVPRRNVYGPVRALLDRVALARLDHHHRWLPR